MDFSERRRALTDASFATFGDAARWSTGADATGSWNEEDVTVRFRGQDEDDRYGPASLVNASEVLRVRSWEVEIPTVGDTIVIADGRHAGEYDVRQRPMLDSRGVWHCPVEKLT